MYDILSTIIFGLLFCVWQKSDWLNVILKAVFFGMTVWGVVKFTH